MKDFAAMNLCTAALLAGAAGLAMCPESQAAPWTFTTLYNFSSPTNAQGPDNVVFGADGAMYGAAVGGGANGWGAIFKYDLASKTETLVSSLSGELEGADPLFAASLGSDIFVATLQGGLGAVGGNPGNGTIVKYSEATGQDAKVVDFGEVDQACFANGLLPAWGSLYGTCGQDANGNGILFRFNAKTGKTTILYTFTNGAGGGFPAGQLVALNGALYGVVTSVNNNGIGGIFAFNVATGKETLVHRFALEREGGSPAGITQCKGVIYGFNQSGGAKNHGTAFSFNPATGVAAPLYTFQGGADSAQPFSATPICTGKEIYQTAQNGGVNNDGTVFGVNITTGRETILHAFNGQDGAYPGYLTLHAGIFYGTTIFGPTANGVAFSGTLFQLVP
jgi:uncharacterized repeat protein (TIGR03803 family)